YGGNRQEAALAAFQAGYAAATIEHNRNRAMRQMMVALRRDPTLDRALYDMGILCAAVERWDDAIKFQQESKLRAAPGSEVATLADAELQRLQVIVKIVASGQMKRREYDSRLLAAAAEKDPIRGLTAVGTLAGLDANRWESHALKAIFQAETADYTGVLQAL